VRTNDSIPREKEKKIMISMLLTSIIQTTD